MITLNGRLCHRGTLHVPWQGSWVAQAALDGAAPTGRVSLVWGGATLVGTVDSTGTGAWQGETRVTIVGGFGWSRTLPPLWIQNDAGLNGLAVAQQAATLAGETLAASQSAFRGLRVSYSRPRRAASSTIADVLAETAVWWVDYGGTTRAGARPSLAASSRVEVLEFAADHGITELDADDVGQVLVGSVISAAPPRRPQALRIVELRAEIGAHGQRLTAAVEVA